jgi:hypothetical protein
MRSRLSYANVMATLAMFIALGGSSYAAITITGKNVKDSSLTGRDIKNNSVRSADVAGLRATDFKTGQLPAGPAGPAGSAGPAGPAGLKGDAGKPATTFFAWVDETGALRRGTPGASAVNDPSFTGVYEVTFPGANLDTCVPLATPGQGSNNGFFANTQIDARIGSWPGHSGNASVVEVFPTNASTGAAKDAAFQLAVFC